MTHIFPIRVYYEDTDMGGIVYHANYLRYIERARSDWVRSIGMDQNAMRDDGVIWVVRRVEADFLASAKFEDDLVVETLVAGVSGVRLTMTQVVKRGDDRLFEAVVTAVLLRPDGKPMRLPANIRHMAP